VRGESFWTVAALVVGGGGLAILPVAAWVMNPDWGPWTDPVAGFVVAVPIVVFWLWWIVTFGIADELSRHEQYHRRRGTKADSLTWVRRCAIGGTVLLAVACAVTGAVFVVLSLART